MTRSFSRFSGLDLNGGRGSLQKKHSFTLIFWNKCEKTIGIIERNGGSIVLYMISFLQLTRGVLKRLDYFRSRFFRQGDSEKRKYRLAKWSVLCRPKDHGWLGIQDLQIKNRALLSKWLSKLLTEEGIWQTLLKRKYICSKTLSQVLWKPGDSHFWARLMDTKKYFFSYGSLSIKDGSEIRFWEDKWLGNTTLRE